MERAAVRRAIFLHQDGVMLTSCLAGMDATGILEPAFAGEVTLAGLLPEAPDSAYGYLRVGLRCLASQGWLDLELTPNPRTTAISPTEAGRAVAPYLDRYLDAARFLHRFSDPAADAWSRPWDRARIGRFEELVERALGGWELGEDLGDQRGVVAAHLDAAPAVPAILHLHARGRLDEREARLPDPPFGAAIARLLVHLGWLREDGTYTSAGRRARVSSQHYGLVASYLPLLSRLGELYRGERSVASSLEAGEAEWHVNRRLNVIASGAAHDGYFADAEELLAGVFDREPVSSQPRFVADMGCGDGSWLVRIHRLVREGTLRGRRLDTDPLLMVGFDCNPEALEQAERVLSAAGVPALLLVGDVTDPEGVRESLGRHGLAIEDGLHVRAFIDHDRDYAPADPRVPATGWPSGAYVDGAGCALDAAAVERNLVEHLRRWAPHVKRHGLVLLEAHSVPPQVARHHVGALHSIAFEGYHGYSHQYPIEHASFVESCQRAGLVPANRERHYPSSRPFVAVSLNHLVTAEDADPLPGGDPGDRGTWRPPAGTPLEDGRGLHGLLFSEGDLLRPRTWCAAPTWELVAEAMEAIESRLAIAGRGDQIRILDYGTGTGLAAIELLKACKVRGLEQRLERLGVTLEVHLADLPSSWFAQGYELLGDCAWTRFHSLRADDGRFRPLLEVTAGEPMDVILASMVFHLIPPQALPRLAAELASALRPGGRLLWSSPDLGPPGAHAVLFHDPNRELRRRWVSLFAEGGAGRAPADLREPLIQVGRDLSPERMEEARARAERRVLPQPNSADAVSAALGEHLSGEVRGRTHEMLRRDFDDALLVPSNQEELLSEVEDPEARERIALWLMREEVMPELECGPAATALGLNVQWTLGGHSRAPAG
jgi:SAM-dependent methyltransferase